jgi:hypothetical protein
LGVAAPKFAEKYSFEKYLNEVAISMSRNFRVDINGTSNNVMVPFADMLNHDENFSIVYRYDNDKQGFRMEAFRDIKEGDEIIGSYGYKSSYHFLLRYAFIFKDKYGFNGIDTIPLYADIDQDIKYYQYKKQLF